MDAARGGVDLLDQRVGVELLEAREVPPVDHHAGDGHVLGGEALELVHVRAVRAGLALTAAG